MTCFGAETAGIKRDSYNRLPVNINPKGGAVIGRQQLQLPADMTDIDGPGELLFSTSSACLLLGPWGPDSRRNLVLRGRLRSICLGGQQLCIDLELERGLPLVQLSLSRHRYESLRLTQGQRLWVSIPSDALVFAPMPSQATGGLEYQRSESGYSPALG